jgi:heme exporter protein A
LKYAASVSSDSCPTVKTLEQTGKFDAALALLAGQALRCGNMGHITDKLEWRDLSIWRGDRCLQKGLSGQLDGGQALTLRGSNGCGKTTLIRTLCGLSEAEAGEVLWGGFPVSRRRSEFYAELAYSGHALGLKPDLTPQENLHFSQGLRGKSCNETELLSNLGLERCRELPVRQLSAGQKQRAAIAAVLGSDANIWALDEPFTHLDAAGCSWLSQQFNEHLAAGGRLLLAAHQSTGINADWEHVLDLSGVAT